MRRQLPLLLLLALGALLPLSGQTVREVKVAVSGTLAALLGENLSEIEEITVRGALNPSDINTLGQLANVRKINLKESTLVDKDHKPSTIFPSYSFYGTKKLVAFSLPASITEIGSSAFTKCLLLQEVELPAGLQKVGRNAFMSCEKLNPINLPEGLREIGVQAFFATKSLKRLQLPNSVTKIEKNAFFYSGLEEVYLGKALAEVGDAFLGGCKKLERIQVAQENPNFAVREGVLFSKDGSTLFAYPMGSKKTHYSSPSSVKKIAGSAFDGAMNLRELTLNEGIRLIPNSMCHDDSLLLKLYLPSTIDSIAVGAFDACPALKEFHLRAVQPPKLATGAFGVMFPNYKMNLYVPVGAGATYTADKSWSEYFLSISEEENTNPTEPLAIRLQTQLPIGSKISFSVVATSGSYFIDWGNGKLAPQTAQLAHGTIQGTQLAVYGAVSSIVCNKAGITKAEVLSGELRLLNLNSNALTTIDLSRAKRLTSLALQENALAAFELHEMEALTTLNLKQNKLTELDLRGLPVLKTAILSNNPLRKLHTEGLKMLTSLRVQQCELQEIAFLPSLKEVHAQNNRITVKGNRLQGHPNLSSLRLSHNPIGTLTVAACTKLKELELEACQLENLEIQELEALGVLYLQSNKISAGALNGIYHRLPSRNGGLLKVLGNLEAEKADASIAVNKGWKVDVAGTPSAIVLHSSKKKGDRVILGLTTRSGVVRVDAGDGVSEEVQVSNEPLKPKVVSITLKSDKPQIKLVGDIVNLDCNNGGFTALDLSQAAFLEMLRCNTNTLTALDVGKAPILKYLYCDNNSLETLNLAGASQLVELIASHNSLTTLEVSACPQLKSLAFDYNNVQGLDLSRNSKLVALSCKKNKNIGTLTLKGLTELQRLSCEGCKLTTLDLSDNLKLTDLYCGDNKLNQLLLSQQSELKILNCKLNALTTLELSKCEKLEELYCFDNENLKTLSLKNAPLLKVLSTGACGLEVLDLSMQKQLQSLSCSFNQLQNLDLSSQGELTAAAIDHNLLATAHIGAPKINTLFLHHNKFSKEGGAKLIATLPDRTSTPSKAGTAVWKNKEEYPDDTDHNFVDDDLVKAAKQRNWVLTDGSTPIPLATETPSGETKALVYPTACSSWLTIAEPYTRGTLFDAAGHLIRRHGGESLIDVSDLPPGDYLIVIEQRENARIARFSIVSPQ